ncbi:hypothetical protein UFOVP116_194 [uncultured Caudovirales phage]|uniref:Uncharacterized protein n=1 Tax=uncultured Caudovirales phage TaxID=2100421 RepID=A0A6J5LE77_9CAUD|nr:hypothetical protein UFOVP116_194 [uncultured Caudovirales phage]
MEKLSSFKRYLRGINLNDLAITVIFIMMSLVSQLAVFFSVEIDKRKACAKSGGEYVRTPFTKENFCRKK